MPIVLKNGTQELGWILLKNRLPFLRKNQDSAFTLPEIVTGLGYSIEIRDFGSFVGGVAGYWLFQNAIENLVKEETVEARKIKQLGEGKHTISLHNCVSNFFAYARKNTHKDNIELINSSVP
jgi:hypothetical protein